MNILINSPEAPTNPVTLSPVWTFPTSGFMPLLSPEWNPESENENQEVDPAAEPDPNQENIFSFPNPFLPADGNILTLTDSPQLIITNSFDDEDEDDEMEDVPDEEDDDVYEEVEAFEDFDDDFDEDFEDEFDEDYEELARIDDEDIEDEDEDSANAPSRYEEEFGDVDGQAKFIPDGGDMPLNEEVLLSEDDLDESDASDFDDFADDDEGEEFNEFDNEI